MDDQAIRTARLLAERCIAAAGGDMFDPSVVVRAALAGYLAASGVPTDQAVQRVTELVAPSLVGPVPMNPLYEGIPLLVPGPVSGAPYYAD